MLKQLLVIDLLSKATRHKPKMPPHNRLSFGFFVIELIEERFIKQLDGNVFEPLSKSKYKVRRPELLI